MAVTVEERLKEVQAARVAAVASSYPAASSAATVGKRRAASSATVTTLGKRRKDSKSPRKSRSTSTLSMGRRKSSTPSGVSFLGPPVDRTRGAPYAGVPTLSRTYLDFSDFFRTMDPRMRNEALEAIKTTNGNRVHGEERWRAQHYDPLYATESCKLAFLIQVELQRGERPGNTGGEELELREHACYRCYTLQPEAAFEDKPHHILVSPHGGLSMHDGTKDLPVIRRGETLLRRFCIQCGVRDGLYPNMSRATSMTGDTWWVCECRHLHWVPPYESYVECRRCLRKNPLRNFAPESPPSVSSGGFSP
ncbi:hypothetical protein LX36DRAFT_111800 [Colletotrichum falcatum]|nr:hypothetical protein LX36DRAFT_111800 [Colletotrichum falcatum]